MSHPSPHPSDPRPAGAAASYDVLADGAPIAGSHIRKGEVLIGRVTGTRHAPASFKTVSAGELRVGEYHRGALLLGGDMPSGLRPVLVYLQQQSDSS